MNKYFLNLFCILYTTFSFASALTPLPLSYGALMYDVIYSDGPGSHATIDAGHWIPNITTFNAGATTQNKITRLYPYSSDIEITCSNVNDITTCSIDPGYAHNSAVVTNYKNAFPTATVMPIVDIALKIGNNKLLLTNTALADNVATALVTQICMNDNAAGVFFDLEVANGPDNPGIFELYRQVSKLLAQPPCKDAAYPNGRYIGVYQTPTGDYWAQAQAMFAGNNNGYYAIPLYDVGAFKTPPVPDSLTTYNQGYVTPVENNANTNANKYKVPYTIIVPAGASFGTFEQTGIYNGSDPNGFQLVTDYSTSNATQLAFVQGARAAACNNQNAYFMGMDYWSWQQYINPSANYLNMPNVPDTTTVAYLQQNASCQ